MSFGPNFLASLDDEVRAFLHIAGIELRENVHGSFTPLMRREGFDWVLWLPHGDPSSMEYWKDVARYAYDELPIK